MSSKKISYGNYDNFTFIGTEKPNNPELGSVVINNKTGLYSIYLDNSWVDIMTTCDTYIEPNDTYIEPKVEYRELKPSICSCCGAPLRSNKCEYCDMEYR